MTREDKIKMLIGLASGEINPEDLKPKNLKVVIEGPATTNDSQSLVISYYINNQVVSKEEFIIQNEKQFIKADESTYPEYVIDGISMDDPDYQQKLVAKMKAEGKLRIRQIGINNWESY